MIASSNISGAIDRPFTLAGNDWARSHFYPIFCEKSIISETGKQPDVDGSVNEWEIKRMSAMAASVSLLMRGRRVCPT
jgi:hypothetical protein